MTMPIVKLLKGLVLATVVLAVPTFAVFGLMANGSSRSTSVELQAQHDPLQHGFGVTVMKKVVNRDESLPDGVESLELRNWTFTSGFAGKRSPTP